MIYRRYIDRYTDIYIDIYIDRYKAICPIYERLCTG